MRTRFTAAAGVLVFAAGILISLAPPASALNVVNVTTTADGGAGSLRAAFITANTDADDTEIVLQAGATYELDTCPGTDEDLNVDGDLDHTPIDDLTITGNGAAIAQLCSGERVIDDLGGGALIVRDTFITGGTAIGDGGGIHTTEPFTLEGSIVAGNTSDGDGGGIQSTFGATITDSTIVFNTAAGEGGGLDLSGGGATSTISGSTVSANRAGENGGGLTASGGSAVLSVSDSTIAGNDADEDGGGIDSGGGGATTTITGSTVADNTSGAEGGGVDSGGGGSTFTVTNSTITGNTGLIGGGLASALDSPITLNHVTLVDNSAPTGAHVASYLPAGGLGSGQIVAFGTVIAQGADGSDCDTGTATQSNGYNYDTDASCGFGAGTGDVSDGRDPELEALADNGGSTPTRLPAFDSPLVDAIPVADCDPGVPEDQRSVSRPQGDGCDIGAVDGEGDEVTGEPPGTDPGAAGPVAGAPSFTG